MEMKQKLMVAADQLTNVWDERKKYTSNSKLRHNGNILGFKKPPSNLKVSFTKL